MHVVPKFISDQVASNASVAETLAKLLTATAEILELKNEIVKQKVEFLANKSTTDRTIVDSTLYVKTELLKHIEMQNIILASKEYCDQQNDDLLL